MGHVTPHWTHLLTADKGLLKGGGKFFVKIAISLQMRIMAKNRFLQVTQDRNRTIAAVLLR